MNRLDLTYQNLLRDILDNGVVKEDRTGTGTKSVFGRQIRHKMSEGFPLLTTKKMAFKTMATELRWFLNGDTNIQYLVKNGCNIWNGDAYKKYCDSHTTPPTNPGGPLLSDNLSAVKPIGHSPKSFIEEIKHNDKFAKRWGDLGPIYGKQWRRWTKKKVYHSTDGTYENIYDESDQTVVDQIQGLINKLIRNPDSRRLMVNAWNVGELDKMTLPPCHYGFQVYTRELSLDEKRKLLIPYGLDPLTDKGVVQMWEREDLPTRAISLMWNQRSVDTFLGLPFNIASYGLLLEMIANEVNMVPDELIGNLGDTHLYLNHIKQAKEQITRSAFYLPRVQIQDGIESSLVDIKLVDYKCHPSIKAPLSN